MRGIPVPNAPAQQRDHTVQRFLLRPVAVFKLPSQLGKAIYQCFVGVLSPIVNDLFQTCNELFLHFVSWNIHLFAIRRILGNLSQLSH